VVAGGRSARFGSPKLDVELDGATLLDHAVQAVATVAETLIIAGPALPALTAVSALPVDVAGDGDALVRLVVDAEPFAGPLAALAGALGEAPTDLAMVVAGDMPGLVPAVLELMLARLRADPAIDAVHLAEAEPAGHLQVFPLALRTAPASRAATDALAAGDRSLVRLLERLRTLAIPASDWLPLDPTGQTLLDIDEPADLERWRARQAR
jgi:molybdopterin-guanine dinucleotide biosynthesis protein A